MNFLSGLYRRGPWPGHPPTIDPKRVMCSDCKFHSAAMAGWTYDRCRHPDANMGSIIRNDEPALCHEMRHSSAQCGLPARWFVRKGA